MKGTNINGIETNNHTFLLEKPRPEDRTNKIDSNSIGQDKIKKESFFLVISLKSKKMFKGHEELRSKNKKKGINDKKKKWIYIFMISHEFKNPKANSHSYFCGESPKVKE